ncbi:MAG: hypothetical protein HOP16_03120 [Acidobacteria bacterium]|nr:hypothetical protein [Acidobacteriota bacterium]
MKCRATPAGRMVVGASMIASEPVDYFKRRRTAARYNRQFPSSGMPSAEGYAMTTPDSLPRTDEVIEVCRRLFEPKRAAIEAVTLTGKEARRQARKKQGFLKSMLDDEDLRANPCLVDFALSDPLLSLVTNYLGTVPTLTRIDLVYSVPRADPGEHISSQLFHCDPEGLRQAKMFLNVFDVEEPQGPFMFIPASKSERLMAEIRKERRQAGQADEIRVSDDAVATHGGLDMVQRLVGPPGSAAIVDTSRCLHAGSRVQPGTFRLCLHIQYCTTPEPANVFDGARFENDPVRRLAVKRLTPTNAPFARAAQRSTTSMGMS